MDAVINLLTYPNNTVRIGLIKILDGGNSVCEHVSALPDISSTCERYGFKYASLLMDNQMRDELEISNKSFEITDYKGGDYQHDL